MFKPFHTTNYIFRSEALLFKFLLSGVSDQWNKPKKHTEIQHSSQSFKGS
jgi:hypothetical protein